MAHQRTRRSAGTILMAIGLLLILAVAGYLAWSELQAAQVRAALRQTSAAAQAATAEPVQAAAVPPTAQPPATQPSAVAPPTALPPTAAPPTATEPVVAAAAVPTDLAGTSVPPTPRATATLKPAPATAVPSAPAVATAAETIEPVRLVFPVANLTIDTQVEPMGWEVVQTANGPASQWVIPKNVAGHHIDSAGLGQGGNIVISGHNNIFGQVFKPISLAWDNDRRTAVDAYTDQSDVLNGMPVRLYGADGKEYVYVVAEFYRLKDTGVPLQQRLDNARFIRPTDDERLTLVTCWPPSNNTHRLIVIAKPAP